MFNKFVSEGKKDYRAGKAFEQCPYNMTSEEGQLWQNGWLHVSNCRRRARLIRTVFNYFLENGGLENDDIQKDFGVLIEKEVKDALNRLNLQMLEK